MVILGAGGVVPGAARHRSAVTMATHIQSLGHGCSRRSALYLYKHTTYTSTQLPVAPALCTQTRFNANLYSSIANKYVSDKKFATKKIEVIRLIEKIYTRISLLHKIKHIKRIEIERDTYNCATGDLIEKILSLKIVQKL